MKYILLLLTLLTVQAQAVQVNPDVEPAKTLVCVKPIEDTQGRPLLVGATQTIRLYTSDSVNGPWTEVNSGTDTMCSFTVDTTKLAEGFTYYEVSSMVAGIESARSNRVQLEVVITRIPKPPTNLGWQ